MKNINVFLQTVSPLSVSAPEAQNGSGALYSLPVEISSMNLSEKSPSEIGSRNMS